MEESPPKALFVRLVAGPWTAADLSGFVPTLCAEDLESRLDEPLLRGCPIQSNQRRFALGAPSVGASMVSIVAPIKPYRLASVHADRDVLTHQTDALAAVSTAVNSL